MKKINLVNCEEIVNLKFSNTAKLLFVYFYKCLVHFFHNFRSYLMYRRFTLFLNAIAIIAILLTTYNASAFDKEVLTLPDNTKTQIYKQNTQIITSQFPEKLNDGILSNNSYFFDNFNSSAMPSGYTFYDIDKNKPVYNNWANYPWVPYLFDDKTNNYNMISTSYYNPAGQSDDWMITPSIFIGEGAYLSWEAMSWNATLRDGYEVRVSTNGVAVEDFETVVFSIPAENIENTNRYVFLEDFGFKNQEIFVAFRNNSDRKFVLSIDNVALYKPDQYNVQMLNIVLPKFQPVPGDDVSFTGMFRNMGTETITNFTLTYTDNDGEQVDCDITGVNIPLHGTYNFTHKVAWNTTVTGPHNIKIWVSKINGNDDQFKANDKLSGTILAYDVNQTYTRYPIIESFTSATCPPCKPGNEVVDNIIKNYPDMYTIVKYQMNWPGTGDIYYNADGDQRKTYYAVNSVPQLYADGALGINSNYFTDQLFLDAKANPAFVKLEGSFSVDGRAVTVGASVISKIDINRNDLVLHCAVMDKITKKNVATNGETQFHHVMHKMLPNGNGTIIKPLVASEKQDFNLSFEFPVVNNVEDFSNLVVAVFLQNRTTKEIYNSAFAVQVPAGVNDANRSGNGIIIAYPNPAEHTVNLQYLVNTAAATSSVSIFNIQGELLYSANLGSRAEGMYIEPINVANIPVGNYILELSIGTEKFSQKISVVR